MKLSVGCGSRRALEGVAEKGEEEGKSKRKGEEEEGKKGKDLRWKRELE